MCIIKGDLSVHFNDKNKERDEPIEKFHHALCFVYSLFVRMASYFFAL